MSSHKFTLEGSLDSRPANATADSTDVDVLDLGFSKTYPQKAAGSLTIAGTEANPYDLGLEGIPSVHLFALRVLGGASVTVVYTSAGVEQRIKVSEKFLLHAPTVGDEISGIKLIGSGDVEFVAAGTNVASTVVASPATLPWWSLSQVGYFIVDYDAGDDSRLGWIVDAPGATFTVAQTSAVAIKTLERLREIVPPVGMGRKLVILIKSRAAGASYLKRDGVTVDDWRGDGFVGYQQRLVRGSDLTNSATDKVVCGAMQAQAGPGAGGEWTCAAGGTTSVFTVSSGTLSAEPALIEKRVRFSPTTATVALRNVCRNIRANTGTQITLGRALPATPAAGDVFFVEQPGVRVARVRDCGSSTPTVFPSLAQLALVGLASTADENKAFQCNSGIFTVAFCEHNGATVANREVLFASASFAFITNLYEDEASTVPFGTFQDVGTSLRSTTVVDFNDIHKLSVESVGLMSTSHSFVTRVFHFNVGTGGSYFERMVRFISSGTQTDSTFFGNAFGGFNSTELARVNGKNSGGDFSDSNGTFQFVDFANCTVPPIKLVGTRCSIEVKSCTGTAGNTDVGIDVASAKYSSIKIGSGNTLAGTLGELRLGGSAIATYNDLATTDVVDNNRNVVFLGTGTTQAHPAACTLVTNQSGAGLAVKDVVRGNGVLSVTGQVTSAQAITDDATASFAGVMVTAPANTAPGYLATHGDVWAEFVDGAGAPATPTSGAIAYLSPASARRLTTVVPALAGTNRKLRVGKVLANNGSEGLVRLSPENLSVLADGNP